MKRLAGDEWCMMFCEPVPFALHKMCVFYRLWLFFFHFRGSCSEAHVCARVWWTPWICLCLSLIFPLMSFLSLVFIYYLPAQSPPTSVSLSPFFPHFLSFLVTLFILPSLASSFSSFSPSFFSLLLVFASKVPWEPCGSSAGRHTNTTAATTGTSLSFLSLHPLPRSCLFFPSSLCAPFFSSSLFNVEVLSNCWLLLWLGGNGIFRRMPHAVALTHSWVPC